MHARFPNRLLLFCICLNFVLPRPCAAQQARSRQDHPPGSRRSQRVRPMQEFTLASPDGNLKFILSSNAERLTYSVTLGGTEVIEPSPLVMNLDGYDLSSGVVLSNLDRYEMDETFPWHGTHSTATNQCRGAKLVFAHDLTFINYTLEVRVFNNAVAFRHVIPGDEHAARVPDERSAMILPAGTTVWFEGLSGHYEASYEQRDISAVPAGQWAGPPLTFELPHGAGYGAITEANLVDYAGMALESDGRRGWMVGLGHRQPLNYPFELRYGREEGKRLAKPAAIAGTITTPWRVILLGRDLNTLVNSDALASLCPQADPKFFPAGLQTPWVEPGLAVWDYLDRNYLKPNPDPVENMKNFSRLGSELDAKYNILEGFAYGWSDEQIKDFIDYSKKLGVRALFWRHSRDLRTAEAREEFFARLERLGVAGAKIDFIDQETKEGVDLYESLLRCAAEHHCLIDFHGANKPTGRMRTWPNDILHEAVRGMESSTLRDRARHETILPFTRYLAGPCDYTTMHFGARRADSTWAHQIACLATFQSPILTISAHPQSVLDNPAVELIKSVPPIWDETIVLPSSRIGELSMFARRKGDMWMLAIMAAAGPPKTLAVPLDFLPIGNYQAMLVRDNQDNDAAVELEIRKVTRDETLTANLRSGGGFIGRFTKTP